MVLVERMQHKEGQTTLSSVNKSYREETFSMAFIMFSPYLLCECLNRGWINKRKINSDLGELIGQLLTFLVVYGQPILSPQKLIETKGVGPLPVLRRENFYGFELCLMLRFRIE